MMYYIPYIFLFAGAFRSQIAFKYGTRPNNGYIEYYFGTLKKWRKKECVGVLKRMRIARYIRKILDQIECYIIMCDAEFSPAVKTSKKFRQMREDLVEAKTSKQNSRKEMEST